MGVFFMFTGLVNGLDSLFVWLSSAVKQNFADYCDLETAQNYTTLVAKDGSLLSILRLNGIKKIISDRTYYATVIQEVSRIVQPHLDRKGHAIQFWFSLDPQKSKAEIKRLLEPSYETAKRLHLDLEEMLNERVKHLSNWVAVEENYVVLWTRPSALVKSELKEEKKKKTKIYLSQETPMANGQNPYAGIILLQDRHNSFVESCLQDLQGIGIDVKALDVREASRMIKKSIDEEFTGEEWEPSLPGDKIYPNIRKVYGKAEEWDIIWPKLNWQICNRDATIIDNNFVQVGDTVYAPIYIDLMPKEVKLFAELFGKLINKKDLPWRINYTIEGDGLAAVSTKALFASILAFTSDENKLLNNAVKELKAFTMQAGTVVKFRVSLCTWAKKSDIKDLNRKLSDLARAVEGWGTCIVSEVTGDPIAGMMSSALGATMSNIATTSAAPLQAAVKMLPLSRPCSPWDKGAITFRSPDGKLMPYQPMSSVQSTWINLIFAKPGSGKSVLMNMSNLALCLAPGLERLPRIGIVDIGPSSSGLISLIQEALPTEQKHLAAYYRLSMTEKYCVNPFDTQVCCRFPTADEKAFLVNFLALLATDPGETNPPKGISGLVAAVIDEMYSRCSDKNQPKTYDRNVEFKVDEALKGSDLKIDNKTTWWDVVDALFKIKKYHEAMLAQRHAVPLLSDATAAAQDEKIRSIYEKIITDTGETVVEFFIRMISESLGRYRILARPTVFDIGDSRIVSLDLDEVAKTGGPIAERQTAVMYLLARYILAKDFKLLPENVQEMPYPVHIECPREIPVEAIRAYHKSRAEEIKEDLKRLCFDEFHRTSKAQMVQDQVIVDMREGRKWNLDITLSSQDLNDFNKQMKAFATTIFIMDGGNVSAIKDIAETFGLEDEAEFDALQRRVHGPRKGGGTFLAKFYTKDSGQYTQLLTNTLGPVELWAFSTTVEDVAIRTRLYQKLGHARARQMLAMAFPGGTAKKEVENRKEQMRSTGTFLDDDTNVYDALVDEIIKKYNYI
jgi:intracellular multiplication protein IcmB